MTLKGSLFEKFRSHPCTLNLDFSSLHGQCLLNVIPWFCSPLSAVQGRVLCRPCPVNSWWLWPWWACSLWLLFPASPVCKLNRVPYVTSYLHHTTSWALLWSHMSHPFGFVYASETGSFSLGPLIGPVMSRAEKSTAECVPPDELSWTGLLKTSVNHELD